ncbi:lantibiotic dehydratase C-terminal domain-containing protein [Brevibacterium luteolum]|uniref:lantibiotic dehydratase C-terminal domain-containing protein n=1 Tax=Brevibacterium luteolum TaxID=199591 RepID=UPI003B672737
MMFEASRFVYWQVIHQDFTLDDAALTQVVEPAVGSCCPGAEWHFLRYFDERGPHLRVRVAPPDPNRVRDLINGLTRELEDRLSVLLAGASPSDHRQTSLFDQSRVPLPLTRDSGVHLALYEPEVSKYGGEDGLSTAMQIWAASTEEALRHISPQWTPEQRFALAAGHCYLASKIFFDDEPDMMRRFWTRYALFWSGGDQERLNQLSEDSVLTELLPSSAAAGRADGSGSGNSWPGALAKLCDGDVNQLNHQVHLHNNRLGLPPVDETPLAVLVLMLHRAHVSGAFG